MKNELKAAIVDDEEDLCFLLEMILQQQNFDTTSVNSIAEADRVLFDLKPDIVFLDNQLPDGRGLEFIKVIKRELPATKVLMMTAYNSDIEELEAMKRGADIFLKKPLSVTVISRALESLQLGRTG